MKESNVQMESMYLKLYDKYTKLKHEKFSHLEEQNRDLEEKFLSCLSASDKLIEHLRCVNTMLHEEVNNLKSEMASNRFKEDKEKLNYKELLMEEKRKNNELSEEILRLQSHKKNQEFCSVTKKGKNEMGKLYTSGGSVTGLDTSSELSVEVRKRLGASGPELENRNKKRNLAQETRANDSCSIPFQVQTLPMNEVTLSSNFPHQVQTPSIGAIVESNLPDCCKGRIDFPGGDSNVTGSVSCIFQDTMECAFGLKLSAIAEKDGISTSAIHQSSGYSFTLKLVKNSRGDAELMYNVLSLGAFEKVAPEWMREVIIFSKNMCPVFFERVIRVIGLQY